MVEETAFLFLLNPANSSCRKKLSAGLNTGLKEELRVQVETSGHGWEALLAVRVTSSKAGSLPLHRELDRSFHLTSANQLLAGLV